MELCPTRWSVALEMVRQGEIVDGKTLIALLFTREFRAIGQKE
jgi:hypothetical protein